MRLLSTLGLILTVLSFWSPAQTASPPRSIELVAFRVNPDVKDFSDKDNDAMMGYIAERLEDGKLFSSVICVPDKQSISASSTGLVLEGVVTRYQRNNAAKIITFGIDPTQTTLKLTYKVTDKASGKVLVQKEVEARGARGGLGGFLLKDWAQANSQMARIIVGKVNKLARKI